MLGVHGLADDICRLLPQLLLTRQQPPCRFCLALPSLRRHLSLAHATLVLLWCNAHQAATTTAFATAGRAVCALLTCPCCTQLAAMHNLASCGCLAAALPYTAGT